MTTTSPSRAAVPAGAPGPEPVAAQPQSPAGPARPRWERPALAVLLLATSVLYLWDLSASGYGNEFYAAAAQAGSQSWEAFFYAASDAAASITVDKTPASVWAMALSVRLFGLSSWSVLAPQALMGVASVGLLFATVRRHFGPGAGLLAGAALALTPVAVLMFRFDNPDALLVLCLVAAVWATQRGLDVATTRAGTRWFVLAGALVGLGFLTKMLQAFLVLPALAVVVLACAAGPLRRRVGQVLAAGLAVVVAAGWWVAVVELVPASMRPYIGGSQTNSVWELTLGYNGLGRLTGDETGSVGGGGGPFSAGTGLLRLFDAELGGQAAWLLPAALALLVVGLVVTARRPRTDPQRAAFGLWGGWLLVTGLVFSFMAGIFHAYYTVALAPAVAALVGMGAGLLWQRRRTAWAGPVLGAVVLGSAWWAWVLLGRSADFQPWLRPTVLVVGTLAAVALAVGRWLAGRVLAAVAALAVVAVLAGPTAYAVQTAGTAHGGSLPTAGPTVAGAGFGGGPGGRGGFGGGMPPGMRQGLQQGTAQGMPQPMAQGMTPPGGGAGGGAGGGFLGGSADADVTALLEQDASSWTWVAATVGSQTAATYQLATGSPVMPIGGFNGSDPSTTLADFQALVADGQIHWFIATGLGSGGMQQNGGSDVAARIAAWVAETYEAQTVGSTTVYDLTSSPTSGWGEGGSPTLLP